MNSPRPTLPSDFEALRRASARLGADPLLIQAAGGNTSVKQDGVLWIKASGARLADALARDAFVAVDLVAMRGALAAGAAAADRPAEFALGGGALRPSIETSLHAIFPKRVVLHAHCVNTIAFAIRKDARERLAERLDGFAFVFQPYVKPGARLADAVARSLRPGVDVVVLGNHGLVTAGETVEAAERLMLQVSRALREPAADFAAPDVDALSRIAGDGYEPLESAHPLHGVARSPRLLQVACGGALYPDHIVFCGGGATALAPGETAGAAAARRTAADLAPAVFLLAPGKGALIRPCERRRQGARALSRRRPFAISSRRGPGLPDAGAMRRASRLGRGEAPARAQRAVRRGS